MFRLSGFLKESVWLAHMLLKGGAVEPTYSVVAALDVLPMSMFLALIFDAVDCFGGVAVGTDIQLHPV